MESERSAKTLSEERSWIGARKLERAAYARRRKFTRSGRWNETSAHRFEMRCARFARSAHWRAGANRERKDRPRNHSSPGGTHFRIDILLASASNAVVVGFNIKVESTAVSVAETRGVQVKLFQRYLQVIDRGEGSHGRNARSGDTRDRDQPCHKQVFKLSQGIVAECLVSPAGGKGGPQVPRARVVRDGQPNGLTTPAYDDPAPRIQDDVTEVRNRSLSEASSLADLP